MQPTISVRGRLLLAVAAGVAVATVYFAQPLLVTIGQELGIAAGTVGVFVTVTQAGYALGLLFLVPLGDLLDRRRLIRLQFALLAVALLVTGLAQNAAMLLVGLASVGALAVVTQSLVAYGAALSDPVQRGRTVGTITTGIVLGILLARTTSGILTDLAGWRAVYLTASAVCVGIVLCVARAGRGLRSGRSATPSDVGLTYGVVLRSTITLWREPMFRESAVRAFFIFASFSTLWTSIALPLTERGLSHAEIGVFGLIGAAGAFAAGPAGRLADRGHGRLVTMLASVLLATSWLVTAWTPYTLVALAIGAVLLDLAVQAIHVTNQSMIYRPDAGSRLIGGYMVFYSLGSGLGAIASTALYERAGWTGVCILGGLFGVGSLLTMIRATPQLRVE
ncbi:putative MFS family arabinose efflux permease [Kribbella aluminosa]|uniref:MFS family arabinose efflux permease n=1 Tax=Kribbella aluminosa TaxID=416017 RepID=A0ABS4UE27_9ACTN|nr:MFS transporter [Kribbella aluminosa]MBP2349902.1 putative MFS family arabinose efflux permease [Kribbella aluminosa]